MMNTREEIEQSIRDNLPIIFGDRDAVDLATYRQKRDDLFSYGTAVSAPFLGTETIRYQSILLYSSLLYLSVNLFQLGQIKIFDTSVSVDSRLFTSYFLFIVAIIGMFLAKASLDFRRAELPKKQYEASPSEMTELLRIGLLRKHIQEYFWLEIYDAIGRSFGTYYNAARAALDQPEDFKHTAIQALSIDRKEASKRLETRAELKAQESNLVVLLARLSEDENQFRAKAEIILTGAPERLKDPRLVFPTSPAEEVMAVYEQTLRKWLEARNHLNDEHFDIVMNDWSKTLFQTEELIDILARMTNIRRYYALFEILLPVLFAIFAILYVGHGHVAIRGTFPK
jgi:hypothetical protein